MDQDREHRISALIAELAAIPAAWRSPSQNYELIALNLALRMAAYDHAAELDRLVAQKFEEPVSPRDEEAAGHWDMICRRGRTPDAPRD